MEYEDPGKKERSGIQPLEAKIDLKEVAWEGWGPG
jgi:hypothetical protein